MPKRKRSTSPPSRSAKKQCDARIATAHNSLVIALRLGAGFERQKHSRRKKTAQAKNDTKAIERLEAEYKILKGLDLDKLADQHLRRTVGKVKSLREAEALQEYAAGVEKGSTDAATLNVTARLYKVIAVKKAMDSAIEDLKTIVGAGNSMNGTKEGAKEGAKKESKPSKQQNQDVDMVDASDDEDKEDPFAAFNARIAAPSSGEEDSEESVSDDERPPSIGDSESEHDPEDDLEAQSDSEKGSFQGFSDEEEAAASVPSDSETDSDSESLAVPSTKSKSKSIKEEATTTSSFLPALSHAAYFSGSESEASDLDADVAPRKNRRGQRARQKIAEAKFGAKAKHLEKLERKKGWDPKRGAVSGDRQGRGERRGPPRGFGPQQSGGNAEPLGERGGGGSRRDDKGTLHPSWQAAKAAKESKKLKIDLKGSQSKKVVFD